jgi:hypothetical protein
MVVCDILFNVSTFKITVNPPYWMYHIAHIYAAECVGMIWWSSSLMLDILCRWSEIFLLFLDTMPAHAPRKCEKANREPCGYIEFANNSQVVRF